MRKTSIFSDLSAPTEVRVPTLLLDLASVLLDPTKRGLRNPTLKGGKLQLVGRMQNKNYLQIINVAKTPSTKSPTKPNLHQPSIKSSTKHIKPPSRQPRQQSIIILQQSPQILHHIKQESSPSVALHRQDPPRQHPKLGHHTKLKVQHSKPPKVQPTNTKPQRTFCFMLQTLANLWQSAQELVVLQRNLLDVNEDRFRVFI